MIRRQPYKCSTKKQGSSTEQPGSREVERKLLHKRLEFSWLVGGAASVLAVNLELCSGRFADVAPADTDNADPKKCTHVEGTNNL